MSDLPFSPTRHNPVQKNGRRAVPGPRAVSKQTLCLREAESLVAEVENGQAGKLEASPKLCYVLQRQMRVAALNRAVRQNSKSQGFNKSESVSLVHQFQSLLGVVAVTQRPRRTAAPTPFNMQLPSRLHVHFREKDRAGRGTFRHVSGTGWPGHTVLALTFHGLQLSDVVSLLGHQDQVPQSGYAAEMDCLIVGSLEVQDQGAGVLALSQDCNGKCAPCSWPRSGICGSCLLSPSFRWSAGNLWYCLPSRKHYLPSSSCGVLPACVSVSKFPPSIRTPVLFS